MRAYCPPKIREIVDPVVVARLDAAFGVERDTAGKITRCASPAAKEKAPRGAIAMGGLLSHGTNGDETGRTPIR